MLASLRRVAVLLVVLLTAACTKSWRAADGLAPSTQPAPSVAPSTAAAPPVPAVVATAVESASACAVLGVLVTADRGDAAMGYREMSLQVRNCGTKAHVLPGRPRIVPLDEERRPLKKVAVVASRHHTAAPRRITLRPGERATVVLSWRNTVTNPTGGVAVGKFLVVDGQMVTLPADLDLGNTGRLEASAWF